MKPLRLPRWLAIILDVIMLPLAHAVAPWALSRLGPRFGWHDDFPGPWNLLAIIPVAAGFAVILWCVYVHFAAAPRGWLIETTPHYPTPSYLLTRGPYSYSRNPIYIGAGLVWLGWIGFYGSRVILIAFTLLSVIAGPIILPREERGLEARFGDDWRAYARTVPRFLGHSRRIG